MEGKISRTKLINNNFYDELDEMWHCASDHPIALLRSENKLRAPWIISTIEKRFKDKVSVLDIGCGGGFLTNALSKKGHLVTGVDISKNSLEIATRYDETKRVKYLVADAYDLPFLENSFDVVCAMDILEHVEHPSKLIKQASKVLKPGGLFFFHTFNRNFLSYVLVIKGVDWFVKNAPKNMHVYRLFIKPKELQKILENYQLKVENFRGFRPQFLNKAFFKMLVTKNVSDKFSFTFSKGLQTGYCGFATA